MAKVIVVAYPYATVCAEFDVPDGLDEEKTHEYVKNHWNNVPFGKPDLDFAGTDFDVYCN